MPQTGLPPIDRGGPLGSPSPDSPALRASASPWKRGLVRVAEGAALLTLVAVPLTFMPFTVTVFEPAKVGLLRGLALAAALFWLAASVPGMANRLTVGRGGRWRVPPGRNGGWSLWILASAAAVLTLELLSTAVSPATARSVVGSFERGQGWLTTLSVAVVAGLAWNASRQRHSLKESNLGTPLRWLAFIGVGGLPAGVYAAVQARPFGLDPLPWAGDVAIRATGPAGNSVLLGAYLAAALPAAAVMAVWAWRRAAPLPLAAWLVVSTAAGYGLWVTASRGPLLGLGVGATAAGAAWSLAHGRRAILPVLAGVAALGLLAALNAPGAQGLPLMGSPMVERLSQALDPDRSTGRVRMRLWQGSLDAVVQAPPGRLLIGYGPDSQDLVWAEVYPPILAHDEPRGWVPDRAHSVLYDRILTSGLLGALAWWALLAASVGGGLALMGLRHRHIRLAGLAAAVGAAIGAAAPFVARTEACVPEPFRPAASLVQGAACLAAPGAAAGAVGGLIAGLVIVSWVPRLRHRDPAPAPGAAARLLGLAAVTILVGHWVETTVGFAVTSTWLVAWVTAALVAGTCRSEIPVLGSGSAPDLPGDPGQGGTEAMGLGMEARQDPTRPSGSRRLRSDGFLAAAGVGLPLAFAFARPGLVSGGAAVAALLVGFSVVVAAAAMAWPSNGADTDGRRLAGIGTAAATLVVVVFAVVHWVIVAGPWTTPLGGLDAAAASLALFSVGLAISLVLAVPTENRSVEIGGIRPSLARGAAGLLAAVSLTVAFAPSWGEAAMQEAEIGWLVQARAMRDELETGRARVLMAHADDRLRWAARLLPGQPEPVLARARLASELGAMLAERLDRRPEPTEDVATARDAAFANSRDLALQAASRAPGWPEPWLVRARGYRVQAAFTERGEDAAGAVAAYRDAIGRAPRWPEPRVEWARLELDRERPEAALALAEGALALDPFYRPADRVRGAALVRMGRYDDAVTAYADYFDDFRNASDLEARREQLVALIAADRLQAAADVAAEVVRLAPDDPHARADLAAVLWRLGRTDAALDQAQLAAALDPDDPGIGNLLERIRTREEPHDR